MVVDFRRVSTVASSREQRLKAASSLSQKSFGCRAHNFGGEFSLIRNKEIDLVLPGHDSVNDSLKGRKRKLHCVGQVTP
jgi:hypothetical protein